ncbi:MAG TPA: DUF3368 domain-containing protein [Nodularia sp. (in: cyanobacteria)]|nr:DUF3368 domain-containing protein [Nodularia sp. (in: cyanobacteria)]
MIIVCNTSLISKLAAKEQGFVLQVRPILDDLIANGFWIREKLYAEVLLLAGE